MIWPRRKNTPMMEPFCLALELSFLFVTKRKLMESGISICAKSNWALVRTSFFGATLTILMTNPERIARWSTNLSGSAGIKTSRLYSRVSLRLHGHTFFPNSSGSLSIFVRSSRLSQTRFAMIEKLRDYHIETDFCKTPVPRSNLRDGIVGLYSCNISWKVL